jgi:hypothetical protein
LCGARQTGKSTLLKALFPDSLWFDLLLSDVFERLHKSPFQLREFVLGDHEEVIEIKAFQNEMTCFQPIILITANSLILTGISLSRLFGVRLGALQSFKQRTEKPFTLT